MATPNKIAIQQLGTMCAIRVAYELTGQNNPD